VEFHFHYYHFLYSLPKFQWIPRTKRRHPTCYIMGRALAHPFCNIFNHSLNNNMIDVLDHDQLVLFTSLLFPFGDGQVVSDLTATITLLPSVLTGYRFTVLLPCARANLSQSHHCQGNKAKVIRRHRHTLLSLKTEHGNLFLQ
jgi:hypothetical protein